MSALPRMTADELLRLQPPHKSTELLRGRMIVREPPSSLHGRYSATLCFLLLQHVHAARLGAVFGQDTGFHIAYDPDSVRAPDVVDTTQVAAAGFAERVKTYHQGLSVAGQGNYLFLE